MRERSCAFGKPLSSDEAAGEERGLLDYIGGGEVFLLRRTVEGVGGLRKRFNSELFRVFQGGFRTLRGGCG